MKHRTLGRTDLRVCPIGMGGVGAMGKYGLVTPDAFARTMARASELGMNFLDTAPAYGDSEAVFGHYLKDHRDDWIVCTKLGDCGGGNKRDSDVTDAVKEQFEKSLKRLRVDHVDVLLIHSIDQYGRADQAVHNVRASGLIDAMQCLGEQGKTRFIGASGQLAELVPAVESGAFDVALTYNSFNLLVREAPDRLLPLAKERGTGIVLGGAFYQGLLSGSAETIIPQKQRWFERQDPGFHQTQELMDRAAALLAMVDGDAPALRRLAVRFALSDPRVSVVISGMVQPHEVEENAAVAEAGPLGDAERSQIDQTLAAVGGAAPKWKYDV